MCEFEKRLQELKENSFYGINDKDENGNTILHLAAMVSNYPIIISIILRDANVNAKNNKGETPLHRAAFIGKTQNLVALLEFGAKVNAVDSRGRTPLYYASQTESKEKVEVLMEAGANLSAGMWWRCKVVSLYAPSEKQAEQLSNRIMADRYELLDENKFIGESELASLRYKAAKGRVEKVYLYSPEVLAKRFKDQVSLLRELWSSGVEIIFLSKSVQIE